MAALWIESYDNKNKEKWDDFVMNHSVNGTFLQTKNFLDYHGNRFEDTSIIIYKGSNTIAAVIPACTLVEDGRRIFSSHCGSTFGGIVISEEFYDIGHIDAVMDVFEEYLKQKQYDEVSLKCTGDIFARQDGNLLYYFLFQRGYTSYDEISFYIDFSHYEEDIASNFSSARRRGYRYSLKHNMVFRKLDTRSETEQFYGILRENLHKRGAKPVHSLEEILDFKENRLSNIVEIYGVFCEERMVAGSLVFLFGSRVFHTQYLAADQDCLAMYPMNFMDYYLIKTARDRGFQYFSFGTSTFEHGKVLNKSLAEFKEGFGTQCGLNKTYVKAL